jgi:8-oxo-dGTP pyrophosphatase MutT (NUDIX family)
MLIQKETSAGGIVFTIRDGEIFYLLLKSKYKDYWEFPKGRIQNNETIEEAALREVKEETKLKNLKKINGFKEKVEYYFTKNNIIIHKEVYLLLFQTNNIFVKTKEHETYGWFTFEYANKILKESLRKALEKVHSYILSNILK